MKNRFPRLTNSWQKLKDYIYRKIVGEPLIDPELESYDPLDLLDELQSIVQTLRADLDLDVNKQWDLDILAASTYLYHVDRILVKVRENIITYRYRIEQFKNDIEVLKQSEFSQAEIAFANCYIAILNLTKILKKVTLKQIYNDKVVNPIHVLELESANLNSAIRALNQLSFRHEMNLRQETLMQLNALEKSLIQTLSTPPADYVYTHQGIMYSTTEHLRNQLKEVALPEDAKWLSVFVEVQDMLRKCYVVARKGVIKELLDKMNDHIQALVGSFNRKDPNEEDIFFHLTAIFNGIESVRFNCHRENGCSKHLFEKAKIARSQLRKACREHPLGRIYLNKIAIKREPLKAHKTR
ncbi:MAG: hypothetical protein AB7I18_10175 [Candidatus Berkiella sp.]